MYIYFFGSYDFKYKYNMNELQKCSWILLQYCEHFFLEVISKNVIVVGTELEKQNYSNKFASEKIRFE